jgi:two-component system sensor histidine kinase RstB
MKRSFLKLIASSVLAFWLVGFGVLAAYSRTRDFTEAQVREQGLLWAYRSIDRATPSERPQLVAEMADHHDVVISIVPLETVRSMSDAAPEPGQPTFDRRERRAQWLYIPFHDHQGAFAAGPVDPLKPPGGHYPIGIVLAIILTPLVASAVAMRLAAQLRKVERASEALGSGVLSARVDNPDGPSHELAASFNDMAECVERLVKDREELVQAVSHELGSPLSRLQFQLELLDNARDSDERRERVEAMTREIEELHELVAELSSWVQSDEAALKRQDFDAVKPLTDLADLAELHVPEGRDVAVRTELPARADVHADPRLFQRAIENLLRNAVRYAESVVTLSIREADDWVHVTVEDDGPGIPIEERERVLQPFVRVEADRDRVTGGVGLGLAIVSRIVNHHGGGVTVDESAVGGARLTTSWSKAVSPVEHDHATTAPSSEGASRHRMGQGGSLA